MILSEHHITQHHYLRIKNKELNEIYFVMSIRSFIIAMAGIFIPIYLYTAGHSIQDILYFYMIMFSVETLLQFPASLFMTRFGPKHNIALSLPVLVFHIWQLWTMNQYSWPLWSIAITGSMTLAFFWTGYHYDFSESKNKKRASTEVSRQYIIIAILSAIAPFLGGTIAEKLGFHGLFGLVVFLLLFALFPLFITRDKHLSKGFSLKNLKVKNFLGRQMVSIGASGIEASVHVVLWPLFVYLILGSYQKIGAVTSAALILTVITTYYVGEKGDKINKCNYIRFGSLMTGIVHMVKGFSKSIYHVFGANLLTSFSHSFFVSPLVTEYYLHADENSRAEYIFLGELSTGIFRVFFFGIMYLLGFYLAGSSLLFVGMALGGFLTLLIGLMPNPACELRTLNRKIKVLPKLQKVN